MISDSDCGKQTENQKVCFDFPFDMLFLTHKIIISIALKQGTECFQKKFHEKVTMITVKLWSGAKSHWIKTGTLVYSPPSHAGAVITMSKRAYHLGCLNSLKHYCISKWGRHKSIFNAPSCVFEWRMLHSRTENPKLCTDLVFRANVKRIRVAVLLKFKNKEFPFTVFKLRQDKVL